METLIGPTQTKARKKHRCDFCQYPINNGDDYMRSTHTYSGDIYTWKSHLDCDKIATKLNMYEDCDEGLTSDGFQECIINEYDNLEGPKMPRGTEFKHYLDFVKLHHIPNVETKEFWELVKSQYNQHGFICWSSEVFDKAWKFKKERNIIKKLGKEYLESVDLPEFKIGVFVVLFAVNIPTYSPKFSKVRVDFIEFCINKFNPLSGSTAEPPQ
jgi:hypothetical protein